MSSSATGGAVAVSSWAWSVRERTARRISQASAAAATTAKTQPGSQASAWVACDAACCRSAAKVTRQPEFGIDGPVRPSTAVSTPMPTSRIPASRSPSGRLRCQAPARSRTRRP
ncbi:hypothetical protein ABZ078_44450, partial [Streptomyces sp. NPDC006385]|uniref:hypothetical protein n=1 Tax=Streptomyces sp. NPDC006385 TaxID=3156761 RepID=UPI00339DC962